MYSRNFGSVESEQILQKQKEREKEFIAAYAPKPPEPVAVEVCSNEPLSCPPKHNLGFLGGIFDNWNIEDLILIGLTIYLLTDNNHDNDILVILLVLLLT